MSAYKWKSSNIYQIVSNCVLFSNEIESHVHDLRRHKTKLARQLNWYKFVTSTYLLHLCVFATLSDGMVSALYGEDKDVLDWRAANSSYKYQLQWFFVNFVMKY